MSGMRQNTRSRQRWPTVFKKSTIDLMFNGGDRSRQTTTLQIMAREVNQLRNSNQRWIKGTDFLWRTLNEKKNEQFGSRWKWCRSQDDQQVYEDWSRYSNQFENLFKRTLLSTIARLAQRSFEAPIEQLKKGMLSRLDPFVDDNGTIRVGERIANSTQSWKLKHPAIMPKKHRVSTLSREDLTRWTRC